MPLECLDGVLSVLELPIKIPLPDNLDDHPASVLHALGGRHDQASQVEDRRGGSPCYPVDCIVGALIPFVGVANCKYYLCAWVPMHQLRVECASWPVYRCSVAIKDLLPGDRLSLRGCPPQLHVLRMSEHFGHVVARSEAQGLERHLQGHRPVRRNPAPITSKAMLTPE